MPKICYESKRFQAVTVALINRAELIIREYQRQGFDLTLRQLFYQFVARDLIPNTERSYKRLGSTVSNARVAGLLDWLAITDRTRSHSENWHAESPEAVLESVAAGYAIDTRTDQPNYVEVWIEKDALIGIVDRACEELDVPRFSCRGYVSQSAMWRAAQRIRRAEREHDRDAIVVLHLGDHDPSGIDMTRDIQERLWLFGARVEVRRIALTIDQINELEPPPNPTKLTDSRAGEYLARYGRQSWELDALDPAYLRDLITRKVDELTDHHRRNAKLDEETSERSRIRSLIDKL